MFKAAILCFITRAELQLQTYNSVPVFPQLPSSIFLSEKKQIPTLLLKS